MNIQGYIGIDQYNNHYHIKKYPRKELLKLLGYKSSQKMYIDTSSCETKHIGYVIGGLWINVFAISDFK